MCPSGDISKNKFVSDQLEHARIAVVLYRVAYMINERRVQPLGVVPLTALYRELDGTVPKTQVETALVELEKQNLVHYVVLPNELLVALGPCPQPTRTDLLLAVDAALAADHPKNATLLKNVENYFQEEFSVDQIASALRAAASDGEIEVWGNGDGRWYVQRARCVRSESA